jgi:hypothetical protein
MKTVMITQTTLVLVMMVVMVMLDYMVQEGVVQEIGSPPEEVGLPMPHKILTMVHLIHSEETISGRRRSVSFPIQDGIHSSSSSGSSNYPPGQDLVYNPYAWQWQPGQGPSGEVPPSIMYGYGNYGSPPPPYLDLSNMYPSDHGMGMDKFTLHRYVIFALWISIYLSFLFSC